jgi:hypothetical protein
LGTGIRNFRREIGPCHTQFQLNIMGHFDPAQMTQALGPIHRSLCLTFKAINLTHESLRLTRKIIILRREG